jgi:hypothetical protein
MKAGRDLLSSVKLASDWSASLARSTPAIAAKVSGSALTSPVRELT